MIDRAPPVDPAAREPALRRGALPRGEACRRGDRKTHSLDTIPYNLACYACQLNDLPQARLWFYRSMTFDKNKAQLATIALADPDLAPLHAEIVDRYLSSSEH